MNISGIVRWMELCLLSIERILVDYKFVFCILLFIRNYVVVCIPSVIISVAASAFVFESVTVVVVVVVVMVLEVVVVVAVVLVVCVVVVVLAVIKEHQRQ